ncbi:hypothetical protein F4803DRAFT_548580 [Xylaria telfairii]|nr:hypothetical protein F4803DRAFT_548580 [Xylaria telfairii]
MAGNILTIQWPHTNFRPLAQITVVDAGVGDCNIVDFCHYSPNLKGYEDKPWRRTIIDTGPPNQKIQRTLAKLVEEQTLPVQSSLARPVVPVVHELQITHIDSDHIGNAEFLTKHLRKIHKNKNWSHKISTIFQRFPNPWPEGLCLDQKGLVPQDFGLGVWYVSYRLAPDIFKDWATYMSNLGIDIFVRLAPHNDFSKIGMWYETTQDEVPALIFEYTEKDVSNNAPLKPKIAWEMEAMCDGELVGYGQDVLDERPQIPSPAGQQSNPSLGVHRKPINKLRKFNRKGRLVNAQKYFSSVVQLDSLAATVARDPQIFVQLDPEAGRQHTIAHAQNPGQIAPGIQVLASPNTVLLRKLLRYAIIFRWRDTVTGKSAALNHSGEVTNRASIVTAFYRKDLGLNMLFTGDAHDKDCDIRNTIMGWIGGDWQSPVCHVDVLKIPHHGSDKSTTSEFYSIVQAKVYLICGRHNEQYGNPKFSSLKAIVETFRNRSGPFYLFFSNPDADINGELKGSKFPSAVLQLLNDPDLKPTPLLKYEMWKLRALPGNHPAKETMNVFGTILIGADTNGALRVKFDKRQWVQMGPPV